ncbi:MAG: membrane protein insertion efficiency factor YidD [Candidatus Omnitrophica bacterium]|nr:membrane protein insertion efficiency factor YidD [Candidatus Omnitrophota bacterium]MBI3008938.1 membrane protein insertion efficiency factor YidD [Candidatus Omnitrophota bacterium]
MRNFVTKSVLILIKFYKTGISPYRLPSCRFHPSCSSYLLESVEQYGCITGITKGLWRLLRCHPFSKGGYDPVKK